MTNGYRDTPLGRFFKIKHGFAFKGEHFSDQGDYILLTPGNFGAAGGLKLKGDKEKYYIGPIPPDFVLRHGDLIVAMTDLTQNAPILGAPAVVPDDNRFLHNQRLGKIIDLDERNLHPRFLFHVFNFPGVRAQIKASATGSTVKHTAPERIYSVKAPIPADVRVQRKIASVLSTYDDLIENNTKRIKILEEMARSLYREWFVNFRFPGHEKTKFTTSKLGKIPAGWTPGVFTDMAEILSGGTPSTAVPSYWDGRIPWFTPRDAGDSFYVLDTDKHLTDEGVENCASEEYPADTIFITARGTVGKLALAGLPMAVNQSCYAVRGKAGYAQRFLYLALLAQVEYLKTNVGGATFATIVTDTFKRMSVTIPPASLVSKFDDLAAPIFGRVRLLGLQNANLRATRDLLLPRLISGEIDVSSLRLESAAL